MTRYVVPVSQRIWTPLDLDPRSKSAGGYGPPPSPNPLADMDPPRPNPLADMDPPPVQIRQRTWTPSENLDPLAKLSEKIILEALVEVDNTLRSRAYDSMFLIQNMQLAAGNDSSDVSFDQGKMRKHSV